MNLETCATKKETLAVNQGSFKEKNTSDLGKGSSQSCR